jgi:ribosomal protein S10
MRFVNTTVTTKINIKTPKEIPEILKLVGKYSKIINWKIKTVTYGHPYNLLRSPKSNKTSMEKFTLQKHTLILYSKDNSFLGKLLFNSMQLGDSKSVRLVVILSKS